MATPTTRNMTGEGLALAHVHRFPSPCCTHDTYDATRGRPAGADEEARQARRSYARNAALRQPSESALEHGFRQRSFCGRAVVPDFDRAGPVHQSGPLHARRPFPDGQEPRRQSSNWIGWSPSAARPNRSRSTMEANLPSASEDWNVFVG
jgi:hypothetical protein